MFDIDEDDFLTNYQISHFEEDPNDLFKTCASKRKCMFLVSSKANSSHSNETSCALLDDMLRTYGTLVDDRNGVNNFAEATLALLSDVRNGGKSFSSGLPDKAPKLTDILEPIPGSCENNSESGCTVSQPTLSDIQTLFQPVEKTTPKKLFQNLSIGNNPTQRETKTSKNVPKQSLYSSYVENEASHSSRQRGSNVVDQRNPKLTQFFKEEPPRRKQNDCDKNLPEERYRKQYSSKGGVFKNKGEKCSDEEDVNAGFNVFRTAKEQFKIDSANKKFGRSGGQEPASSQQPPRKTLGGKSRVSNRFIPPVKNSQDEDGDLSRMPYKCDDPNAIEEEVDERLRLIDPKMVELIQNEIMDSGSKIGWDDIAGLHFAKATIQEIVVWPMLRPDIFTGLRRPPKGILLFGPPGTGKTLIGKCIASQSNSTFFSISASSLTSKWIGDGEKMVRALFAVARVHQPSVVFIDEIDSLLSQRSDTEHESSRRIKTEFLVQLDGAATGEEDRILVIGATNRPQELDEAARRRLVKRLYIPLPDFEARKQLVGNLMRTERNSLESEEIEEIAKLADGFSGADMKNLCQEACLGPIRLIGANKMFCISAEEVRPVSIDDFKLALKRVKSSVSPADLETYIAWDRQYGSGGMPS